MINSLYTVTSKGFFKALSFTLAILLFIVIFINMPIFAQYFGGKVPYLALGVFYGMAILWVHSLGFELTSPIWQAIFLPLIGYIIAFPTLIYIMFHWLS